MTAFAHARLATLRREREETPCSLADADALLALVARQTTRMDEIADGLAEQRTAFLAVRPTHVESMIERLTASAERTRAVESERLKLVARILGISEEEAGKVRGRDLVRRLPQQRRAAFERALGALRLATTRVQSETRLGARLLEFSADVQERMFGELLAAERTAPAAPGGPAANTYERIGSAARAARTAAIAGRLIDGTA